MNKHSNTYKEWFAEVDRILERSIGLGQDCLADWLSRDAYNDGLSAEEGAALCLEAQDLMNDDEISELLS
jgi:hypothetical protein